MPSYQFDQYHYRIHKAKGGSLSNYLNKTYQPLSDEQIKRHLEGEQLIGVYPLLLNNTSHFIAADFDGGNWLDEARKFIQVSEACGLPVYLERSRSGNGGHVNGCSSQNRILHSRAARFFYQYFKQQEYFLYLIKTQVLIVFFQITTRCQAKVYDYTDLKKGFILWKDQLQSRLV